SQRLLRQQVETTGGAPQHAFLRSFAQEQIFMNPVRDLSQPLVKVRHARLDAHRHARFIHLHHIIVRQLVARLKQSNGVEAITINGVQIVSHQCAEGSKIPSITPAAVASIELEHPPIGGSSRCTRSEHVVAAKKLVGAFAYQYNLDATLAALPVQQSCRNSSPISKQVVETRNRALEPLTHLPRSNQNLLMH